MLFLNSSVREGRLHSLLSSSLSTLFFFIIVTSRLAAAQPVPPEPGPQENLSLVDALRELQAHEDELVGKIDPFYRSLLTQVKQGMYGLMVEELGRHRQPGESSATIRASILRRLRKAGLRTKMSGPYCGGCYARRFDVKTELAAGYRGKLLAVVLKIDIPYGDDSSLYVFEHSGHGWMNVLASEINDYEHVELSQSHFGYEVSAPAPDGRWFVVTGSVNNHAVGGWQSVTFAALSPSEEGPFHPLVLVRERQTIFLGGSHDDKNDYRFRVTPGGFAVSFPVDSKPEGEIWATYSYDVVHGEARAKPPACRIGRVRGRVHPCPDVGGSAANPRE